jgi:hypothetical protein
VSAISETTSQAELADPYQCHRSTNSTSSRNSTCSANSGKGKSERVYCEIYSTIQILLSTLFENRVLRRIFGPKRGGVKGGWRKLHNEELHNLYSSPSIIRIIKSRRMRWAGYVA